MDDQDIGGILDLAYGAAVEPALWSRFLEAFADLTGAVSSALVWQNQRTRQGEGLGSRQLNPGVLPVYFNAFASRHPSQRWQYSPRDRVRHFVPHIVADDDAMAKAELMRTDFYNDFMRPFDLHSVVRLGLTAQGEDAAFLMVSRPDTRDRFGAAELSLAQRLHPHVIRAFELSQKLGALQPRQGGAEAVLAASPQALFILDGGGKVLHANPAAETLIQAHVGLGIIHGRLCAPTGEATQGLHALVARAATSDPAERRGGSMALASPLRRLPLPVTVAPIRAEAPIAIRQEPSVLVCVSDLEVRGQVSEERLRDIFDLTRAEARIAAALFEGATPKETAERIGVSFYTVRGHLVRIFEKTGTSRQSELVRLLAAAGSLA